MTSRTLTFIGFGVIVGAAIVWQVAAVLAGSRATIGCLQRWLMGSVAVRILLFVFWAWLGLHLFARGSG